MGYCIVLTTCATIKEAKALSLKIIEENLAACAQISKIESFYKWNGKVENEPEYKLLIKTRDRLYDSLELFIKTHHSYDVPQIVQIPIQDGSEQYLDWIDESTGHVE